MTTLEMMQLAGGVAAGLALIPVLAAIGRGFAVRVDEDVAVLVTSFGRHVATFREPGWHWYFTRFLPWVGIHKVSLHRDFRDIMNIHINDSRGTSVVVDLWVELRVTDPAKSAFAVQDWDKQLHDLVVHAAGAILGSREFQQILGDRSELGDLLRHEIADDTARWGVEIEQVFIRNVSLLPEISRQVTDSIAARIERAKADIEEAGRTRVAQLEADTSVQIARMIAEAKAQYPAAVSRALERMRRDAEVLAAYTRLYELSMIRPHRTVAFSGFGAADVRPVDAAMLVAPQSDPAPGAPHPGPPRLAG